MVTPLDAGEYRFVLDSSAVLCLLMAEPGEAVVREALPEACLSAVNFAEVQSKLADYGMSPHETTALIQSLGLAIVSFDAVQAEASGAIRALTRNLGFSLGDRACLALAQCLGVPTLTADRAWASVPEIEVRLIR